MMEDLYSLLAAQVSWILCPVKCCSLCRVGQVVLLLFVWCLLLWCCH